MNRLTRIGTGRLLAAAALAGCATTAGAAAAATTHRAAPARPAAVAACTISHRNYAFPKAATSYKAGAAGAVTIAPVNAGTIKVVKVSTAPGYHAYVDSWRGSSVDVYFRSLTHRVKFEAEINDWGGLTITVTTC